MNESIAIHDRPGSWSDRWLDACRDRNIPHAAVCCYDDDIVEQLSSYDALLWHQSHARVKDALLASHLIRCAEGLGLVVFPSTATSWHFDDKLAQKYLLESVGAPLARSHVFFDRDEARQWSERATFPKVFKLKRGASSTNVSLVRTPAQARKLIDRSFGKGFKAQPRPGADLPTKLRKHRRQGDWLATLERLPKTLRTMLGARRQWPPEKGYVYFQDFIPGNDKDTRVTVLGGRAFGFTRGVRPGDFRASGSGMIQHDPDMIDLRCVETALDVTRRIEAQSMAYDFVHDAEGRPLILEICYAYVPAYVHACPGYWDSNLHWHGGHVWPQDAILEDVLAVMREGRPGTSDSLQSRNGVGTSADGLPADRVTARP